MYFRNKVIVVNYTLAIIVVFIHSYNIAQFNSISMWVLEIERFISLSVGELAVPCFFMISAFLFFRDYGADKIWEKYKRRFKSIVVPYIVWNSLYYVAFLILVHLPFCRTFMETQDVELSLKEILISVFCYKYNFVYWFMLQLILYIALSPAIWAILKNKWGIIFPVLFYIICRRYGIPNHFAMLVFWCLGACFALHGREMFERRKSKKESWIFLLMFITILVVRHLIVYKIPSLKSYSDNLLVLNVVLLWFSQDIFAFDKMIIPWWMEISFFIYSAHPMLVDAIKKISCVFLPDVSFVAIIIYFITVILSLFVVTCIAKIMINRCKAIWLLLNGGRIPK